MTDEQLAELKERAVSALTTLQPEGFWETTLACIARLEAAEAVCVDAQYYANHVGNMSSIQAEENSYRRMKTTASVLAAWRRAAGKEG